MKTILIGIMVGKAIPLKDYEHARHLNVDLLVFSPKGVKWSQKKIQGYHYKDGVWKWKTCPFPAVVYNRRYSSTRTMVNKLESVIGKGKVFNCITHFDKWDIYNILRDSHIRRYVPETHLYHPGKFISLLSQYKTLILKPSKGQLGRNIYLIEQTNSSEYKLHSNLYPKKMKIASQQPFSGGGNHLTENVPQSKIYSNRKRLLSKNDVGRMKIASEQSRSDKGNHLTENEKASPQSKIYSFIKRLLSKIGVGRKKMKIASEQSYSDRGNHLTENEKAFPKSKIFSFIKRLLSKIGVVRKSDNYRASEQTIEEKSIELMNDDTLEATIYATDKQAIEEKSIELMNDDTLEATIYATDKKTIVEKAIELINDDKLQATIYATDKKTFIEKVNILLNKQIFIVQQFISLDSIDQKIYDIRLYVQKNHQGKWTVSGGFSRVGNPDSYINNLITEIKSLAGILGANNLMTKERLNQMNSISLQAAHLIEKKIGHLGEMSVDFCLDQQGKIWIIEINGKTQKRFVKRVNDEQLTATIYTKPIEYARFLAKK